MLKTFISYKWEGDAHNRWVEKFARDLRAAGIDAQLDKWEIRFGDSLTDYMTSRIDEASIILCIITDEYVKNVEAPDGQGGATKFEMQMAVSRRTAGDKVRLIGIYRQGSRPPHYLRDHLFADFRDDATYADRLQELVDDLWGKSKRPPLGGGGIVQPPARQWFSQEVEPLLPFARVSNQKATDEIITNSIGIQLKLLPRGSFLMGSAQSATGAKDERPQHQISITEPFWVGVYPVTQSEYDRVMGRNPSDSASVVHCPAENVSWGDAIAFCNRLSQQERLTPYYDEAQNEGVEVLGGVGYRIPTEAEWEYACRGGTETEYCYGDDFTLLGQYAWFIENSRGTTHPVGEKKPNAWGLYDMHGLVEEWCWDWYDKDYYERSPKDNPTGPPDGDHRVHRGGSRQHHGECCRSASRDSFEPTFCDHLLGLRIARSAPVNHRDA